MAEVYVEVTVAGTALVAAGMVTLAVLEEELDAAALLSVELSPDAQDASILASIDFGVAVTVELGVGTSPTRTVACTIVETEDELDENGRWIRGFRAVDALVKLKNTIASQLYEVSPQAVISQVASDTGFSAVTNGIEPYTQPILKNNISGAGILRRFAEDYGYNASLDGTQLRYGRAIDATSVTLTPADQVGRVRVRRSLMDIPSQVKVIGYDWKTTQAAVIGEAAAGDLLARSGGTTAAALVQQTWGAVTLLVESERQLQEGDAAALARGALQRRADRFVSGSLDCNGQPEARPGRTLVLQDLGGATGTYRIRSARHQLDAQMGYRTTITFDSDSLSA